MKASKILLSLMTLVIIFSSTSCKKNKNIAPIDQLPPETQSGKNTFGCLVDGKVFVPKGFSLHPRLTCYYQYLHTNYSDGYYFQISGSDVSNSSSIRNVIINTESLEIEEGKSYIIKEPLNGNVNGSYAIIANAAINEFTTNKWATGNLSISRLDEINQIVSGTFSFTAVNEKGDTVKVTKGRFDMQYTK